MTRELHNKAPGANNGSSGSKAIGAVSQTLFRKNGKITELLSANYKPNQVINIATYSICGAHVGTNNPIC